MAKIAKNLAECKNLAAKFAKIAKNLAAKTAKIAKNLELQKPSCQNC